MTRPLQLFLLWLLAACNGDGDNKPDPTSPIDADGDGITSEEDCNDDDPLIFPGALELCNGADDDCDSTVDEDAQDAPTWYADADGDGYGLEAQTQAACVQPEGFASQAGDCDDNDANFHPGAEELCDGQPADYNCDGSVGFEDADSDGAFACADCNDADAAVFPGADEVCNTTDDDCDGDTDEDAIDAGTWYPDIDADGYGDDLTPILACEQPAGTVDIAGDCNDLDPLYHPGAEEQCTDTVDYNCDNSVGDADADGDTFVACLDCNDNDALSYPGAPESCDEVDNDCDTVIDEEATDQVTWYADADGDTFGDAAVSALACDAPVGYVADGTDCDDTRADIKPTALEVCDADDIDEDCDNLADNDDPNAAGRSPFYIDTDGDGFGITGPQTVQACDLPQGFSANHEDCDDTRADVSPLGTEVCDANGADEDCDGAANDDDTDPSDPSTFYADTDRDGFGDAAVTVLACAAPQGYVADSTDCDDRDDTAYPGAVEQCDSVDDDCDGDIDEDTVDTLTWYGDADGDGYGRPDVTLVICIPPPGYAPNANDCDDTRADVNPGAAEVCDAGDVDEDCDALADDADPNATGFNTFYADADGDGHGALASPVERCDLAPGLSASSADCDDTNADRHPGATEIVGNNQDDDCNGSETCYDDPDNDGHLAANPGLRISADADCNEPREGLATDPRDDCNDNEGSAYPGAPELCNSIDDDCDTEIDEGLDVTWYRDADGDGYGDVNLTTLACAKPPGYVADNTDCNDSSPITNPGAVDVCGDDLDNDCVLGGQCVFDGEYAWTTANVKVAGSNDDDFLGRGVAVGDFNGDGQADLLGGADGHDGGGTSAGAAMLWYGPVPTSRHGNSADLTITGTTASQYTGWDVAASDLDGDGIDDILIGAYGTTSSSGAVHVIYGGLPNTGTNTTAALVAAGGATFTGAASSDYFGYSLGDGGDIDGDGYEELLMGSYLNDSAATNAGAAFLVYGSAVRLSGVNPAASSVDAIFRGNATNDNLGYSLNVIPDVNGDGLDELLIGAPLANGFATDVGAGYLVLGDTARLNGSMPISQAADLTLNGNVASDFAGRSVAGLGDLDGDGYGDYGVHGEGFDINGLTSVGALWVYAGAATPGPGRMATLHGIASSDYFGEEAASPGDLDDDGYDDLVVGAYLVDIPVGSAGSAYLFHGAVSGTISAATADAIFRAGTVGDSQFGRRIAQGQHDVNGDGALDIVIGAHWDDDNIVATGFPDRGAIYIWSATD